MTNRQLILLNLGVLSSGVLIYFITTGWSEWEITSKFIAFVMLAGIFGVIFVAFVLPAIGDRIGEFFYTPPAQIDQDDRQKAMAKVAQGDYEGAIELFKRVVKNEPEDRFPIIEISKIQVEQFNDVDSAVQTLNEANTRGGWRDNDAAFFQFRLAELHNEYKNDKETARNIYQQIIAQYPETRHSANAIHKLNELDAT